MEAMFKTWKEPVPGSMEPTPVFQPEATKAIDAALLKFKAATAQPQRPPPGQPPRPMPLDYRNTPTPPQNFPRYGTPQQQPQQYQNGYPSHQVSMSPSNSYTSLTLKSLRLNHILKRRHQRTKTSRDRYLLRLVNPSNLRMTLASCKRTSATSSCILNPSSPRILSTKALNNVSKLCSTFKTLSRTSSSLQKL